MKPLLIFIAILVLSSHGYSQSGRRAREIKLPVPPPPEQEINEPTTKPSQRDEAAPVTAEKNRDYRCTEDGSLAVILDDDTAAERVLTAKEVDTRVEITDKPKPSYTKEARRNGI